MARHEVGMIFKSSRSPAKRHGWITDSCMNHCVPDPGIESAQVAAHILTGQLFKQGNELKSFPCYSAGQGRHMAIGVRPVVLSIKLELSLVLTINTKTDIS